MKMQIYTTKEKKNEKKKTGIATFQHVSLAGSFLRVEKIALLKEIK